MSVTVLPAKLTVSSLFDVDELPPFTPTLQAASTAPATTTEASLAAARALEIPFMTSTDPLCVSGVGSPPPAGA
ncbi:hypothetical protein Raf01_59260 [Rugosimonospora africana]|uniref:Uncharacterized protein n=1 Tax=Rugosimonospora africana TaxID=556532 RepID=A0A8J3VT61_9ACTN|nr:hypothetical protein Raf01_59260 [Rugosimonospora africana]